MQEAIRTRTCTEDHVKTQGRDGLLQAKDEGPRTNPPCRPLALRLPVPKRREDTLLLFGCPFHELQMGLKLLLVAMKCKGSHVTRVQTVQVPNQPFPMATATPSPRRDTTRPGARYLPGKLGPQTTRGLCTSARSHSPHDPLGLRLLVVTQPPWKPRGRKASEILTELPDNHPQQEEPSPLPPQHPDRHR